MFINIQYQFFIILSKLLYIMFLIAISIRYSAQLCIPRQPLQSSLRLQLGNPVRFTTFETHFIQVATSQTKKMFHQIHRCLDFYCDWHARLRFFASVWFVTAAAAEFILNLIIFRIVVLFHNLVLLRVVVARNTLLGNWLGAWKITCQRSLYLTAKVHTVRKVGCKSCLSYLLKGPNGWSWRLLIMA